MFVILGYFAHRTRRGCSNQLNHSNQVGPPFEAFVRRHHYDDIRCAAAQQRPRRVGAPGVADPR